jgi:hypothetical protein
VGRARTAAIAFCLLVALASASCSFSTAPTDNTEFAMLTDLHQLDGRYRNRGLGSPDAQPPMFLSRLLFPADTTLDHEAIEVIDVCATGASTLAVKALDTHDVVVEETAFLAGRDFTIEAGRLRIRRESALLSHAPDDPLVGPRMETVELGLDLSGFGKYRSTFTGAGLVYLLVPVAIHDTQDVRFERIRE